MCIRDSSGTLPPNSAVKGYYTPQKGHLILTVAHLSTEIAPRRPTLSAPSVTFAKRLRTKLRLWQQHSCRSTHVSKLTSTETVRLIGDGEKGEGVMEVGEEGDYYTYRYAVTTRMTPALRWAVIEPF